MLITKYFSKDSNRFYRQGSFRFGTLVEYRTGEQFRFTDKFEGIQQQIVNLSASGPVVQVKIGNLFTLENCGKVEVRNASFRNEINEHIFCCSLGSYDRSHHREMLSRNSDLTHFAEIDFVKFMDGIMVSLRKHEEFNHYARGDNLYWEVVQYGDRGSTTNVQLNEAFYEFQPSYSMADVLRTIFTKPPEFSYEKELRLVVRLDGDRAPSPDAKALNLRSRLLRESIVRFGSVKGA